MGRDCCMGLGGWMGCMGKEGLMSRECVWGLVGLLWSRLLKILEGCWGVLGG